jgi:UTP-glucose-1-phosphate uridylyltransferase
LTGKSLKAAANLGPGMEFFHLIVLIYEMIKKCLFPAAGYGTRFLPATKAVPKEMLPVLTKPLLQYGVEEALSAGITNMAIVTGRG